MKFSLLPKEFEFFDLFEKLASCAVEAAGFLHELTQKGQFTTEVTLRMHNIEHRGDDITHEIIHKLNKTFITPFDREDIYALAHELDSVIDIITSMTSMINLYNIRGINQDLIQFSSLIKSSVEVLVQAVNGLREIKKSDAVLQYCIEVNRLENMGDQLRDKLIGQLFDNSKDPIRIIKWKDIFQEAELTLDKCEDVVNIVEAIIVKQG